MSKAEVRAVETAKPTEDPDDEGYLLYRDSVEGLNCLLGYLFINDRLVRALYVIDQKHTDLTDYLSDYQRLKQVLSEEYGQPAKIKKSGQTIFTEVNPPSTGTPSASDI